MSRAEDLEVFYALLAELEETVGGTRILAECDGRMDWPSRGVYFFFESGEKRQNNPNTMRVVRVGTHAVDRRDSTLWSRLRDHRGTEAGSGSHRASVFRRHVGDALIAHSRGAIVLPSWSTRPSPKDKQVKAAEKELEYQVSEHISQMPLLWVEVDDEPSPTSDRSLIEKNAIALLAGATGREPLDPPSDTWLGHFSPKSHIRHSGLWNVDYVGEPENTHHYNPAFIDVLARYVKSMA